MTGREAPHDLLEQATATLRVGGLRTFPFLRIKGQGSDRLLPLAPLPMPDVIELPNVPSDLRPVSGADGEPGQPAGGPERVVPDEELLRPRLLEATQDPGTRALFIEERAYFPFWYSYRGAHFTAIVDGGAGAVLAVRRPGRTHVVGERFLAPPAALLLLTEGLLLPTLAGKLAGIAMSAVFLFFLLRWIVARHA
jgi:hypothetical protein